MKICKWFESFFCRRTTSRSKSLKIKVKIKLKTSRVLIITLPYRSIDGCIGTRGGRYPVFLRGRSPYQIDTFQFEYQLTLQSSTFFRGRSFYQIENS